MNKFQFILSLTLITLNLKNLTKHIYKNHQEKITNWVYFIIFQNE